MPGLSGVTGLSGLSGLFGGIDIPLTIDGLQLWLKGDEGTFQDSAKVAQAFSDGDVIGAWADQSGNGNDLTQITTSLKPGLRLNVLNTRQVVRFDGTDDRLTNSSFSLAQPMTMFIVSRVFASDVNGATFIDSFDNVICILFQNSIATTFGVNAGGSFSTANDNNWNIHNVEFDGASSEWFINGASVDTGNVGANGYSGLSIGDARGNPNPVLANFALEGDIAEILIYNSILSDADRQIIENYLNGRYAIF